MVEQRNIKTLMQWTTSKIRLILRLYLEQRTRPGLLLPVMIMCSSSGNSWLGLGRRCALDHSQVATSCQPGKRPWWLLKSTAYVWSSFCAFSINWVLSKLSDLVNSLWRSGNSGVVENVCKLQREVQIAHSSGWALYLRLPYCTPVVPCCWLNSEVVKTAPCCS